MLTFIADSIFALILVTAPLLYAAVDLPVQMALGILSVILLNVVYCSKPGALKEAFGSPFVWLGAVMGVFVLFQLVPLPVSWLKVLSVNTYQFYRLYTPFMQGPRTSLPLSVYPFDTICALVQFLTYACVFLSVLMRLSSTDIEKSDDTQAISLKKNEYLKVGCLTGVLAILFHSLYDFNLHITANGIYFVTLLGLAVGGARAKFNVVFFRWTINTLITTGFCIALFAIIQKFSFNGHIYWIGRQAPEPVGPYYNYDHFAGFMAMCSCVAMGMLVASIFHTSFFHCQGYQKKLLWLSTAEANKSLRFFLMAIIMISTVFMSASRGGIMSFALGQVIFFSFILAAAHRVGKAKRFWAVFVTVILMAGIMVVWLGPEAFLERFHLTSVDKIIKMESPDSVRILFYKDTLKVIKDFPLAGTGLGTFGTNFSRYRTFDYTLNYLRNTHNDYLHLVSETGIMGWVFILGFLWLFVMLLVKTLRRLE